MRSLYVPYQDDDPESEVQSEESLRYALLLFVMASTMILFGLTVLYSTSYGVAGPMYFKKQLIWGGVGLVIGCSTILIGYRRLVNWSPWFMILAVLLLIAALGFPAVKGAHRWIKIPHIGNIQPSELAKLAMALFLARFCADKMRNVSNFTLWGGLRALLKGNLQVFWSEWGAMINVCAWCGILMVMVMVGKDLGTTTLLGIVLVSTLFLAGLKLRYVVVPVICVPPLAVYIIKHHDPMRWARITSFLNPEQYLKDDGYQLWNSLLALGSGGWSGVGFMASRLKHKYLPEAHTDFILSIVGEELGMVGLCCVIACYLVILFAAVKIAINASTRQGMFLGSSLAALVSLQAFINIGVVSGMLPTKGMPAPFISYGGSNLLMSMVATSLLLSIALDTARPGFAWDLVREMKKYLIEIWHKWI